MCALEKEKAALMGSSRRVVSVFLLDFSESGTVTSVLGGAPIAAPAEEQNDDDDYQNQFHSALRGRGCTLQR